MIATFCFSTSLIASGDISAIDKKIGSLKLEKMQVESMIATMIKRGRINSDEGVRIKREVASVKEEDIEKVKSDALENLDSKSSYATK